MDTEYKLLPWADAHEASPEKQHSNTSASDWRAFPGCRKVVTPEAGAPAGHMLVKTGGNALQSVARVADTSDLISVSVPEGVNPGDMIMVASPDGKYMEATVPPGALPGTTFFIRRPAAAPVVAGMDMPLKVNQTSANNPVPNVPQKPQKLTQKPLKTLPIARPIPECRLPQKSVLPFAMALDNPPPKPDPSSNNQNKDLILVRIPTGALPGSKLRVTTPDGRLMEATVPQGNVTEFYMRVPPPKWQEAPCAPAAEAMPFYG
jgi:hypothetical protein